MSASLQFPCSSGSTQMWQGGVCHAVACAMSLTVGSLAAPGGLLAPAPCADHVQRVEHAGEESQDRQQNVDHQVAAAACDERQTAEMLCPAFQALRLTIAVVSKRGLMLAACRHGVDVSYARRRVLNIRSSLTGPAEYAARREADGKDDAPAVLARHGGSFRWGLLRGSRRANAGSAHAKRA